MESLQLGNHDMNATLKSNWLDFYQTNIVYIWMTVVFTSIATFLQYWWITNLLEITAEEGRVPQQTVTEDGEEEYYYDNAYDAVN